MTIILSPRAVNRACLTDHPDGVLVEFSTRAGRRGPYDPGLYRFLHREVVDAPFHVVRDAVADLLGDD